MDSLSQSSDPVSVTLLNYTWPPQLKPDFSESAYPARKIGTNGRGPVRQWIQAFQAFAAVQFDSWEIRRCMYFHVRDVLKVKLNLLLPQRDDSDIHENGEDEDEQQRPQRLRRKMEESQKKMQQLQEQQAQIANMQMAMTERLNDARRLRDALVQQEQQDESTIEDQLSSDNATLQGKLARLQNKKNNVDQLVSEIQAFEMSERETCVSTSHISP